jgi:thiol-disulfide isomerase/thioredoxin
MKYLNKIIFLTLALFFLFPLVGKTIENKVNVYVFYGRDCPHCKVLLADLETIKQEKSYIQIYKYEVTYNYNNANLFDKVASQLGASSGGVPFTVIGTKYFVGYSSVQTKSLIEYTIKIYSLADSYSDPVGKLVGKDLTGGTATYEELRGEFFPEDVEKEEKEEVKIELPVFGSVSTKDVSLPVISILIGFIDGFNPCAMWVLLFLISVLIGMKDRKKMWILGTVFLGTSALIYLLFMIAWLNVIVFLGALFWIKLLIASIALIGGVWNLKSFFINKEDGCEVVSEKKRSKVLNKIKYITSSQKYSLAIIGIIGLAVSVNFIELTCSAGLPVVFTNLLALNNLSVLEYGFYLFLYILFFLIDDLLIFFIAMKTLKITGLSNKYAKYSHLIGGILMVLVGILMIFKPEWLMFNF